MSDNALGEMSWGVFERNRQAICSVVAKILAVKDRRKRVMAVYEKESRSDDPIAEIYCTPWGPVVIMADAEHGSESEHISDTGRGRDVLPFTGEPNQQFIIQGKSKSYVVGGGHFITRTYPDNFLAFRR